MIVHWSRDKLAVIEGTRFLVDPLGLQGTPISDPLEPERRWFIQWLLAPINGRRLGGVRAKLIDEHGFTSFINQRDLEVILGHDKPGNYCRWLGEDYVSPTEPEWYGLCCDDEDLRDDIFERECQLREHYRQYPYLPQGLEVKRRLHIDYRQDFEQLDTLLWDMDPDTFVYPDTRLETVSRRWSRVERTPIVWRHL